MEKRAKEVHIGDNSCPDVELFGPHANQFRIFVTDEDGDVIALAPAQARALMKKLKIALGQISWQRYGKYKSEKQAAR